MSKLPTWHLKIEMRLGHERQAFARHVDLSGPVRSVLADLVSIRDEAKADIDAAYDSILTTSSQELSKNLSKTKRIKRSSNV